MRTVIFIRDGHRCAECGGYGNEIDHIQPRVQGGSDHPSNLRVLCAACNRAGGARLRGGRSDGNRAPRSWPGAITLEE